MNEVQFEQLLGRAYHNVAPAEILAAVELEPGLVTRGGEGDGITILHLACIGGHVDLARDLVDRHANVHQQCTARRLDALMYASTNGHIPVMEFLLSRGAAMTAHDNRCNTALGLAAVNAKLPACKFLISRGSDLMAKNYDGKTALALLHFYGGGSSFFVEEREKGREELRVLFAKGPHPSQVQRRRDVNWARRWPFMFVVVSCGFRPLPAQLLAGLSLVPLSELPQREYCLRVILCSDFLLRRIVSFL